MDHNIRLAPDQIIIYDQNDGKFYRQDGSNPRVELPPELFTTEGLRNADIRIESKLIESQLYYVDRITGMKFLQQPNYTWEDGRGVKHHAVYGGLRGQYPTGLHLLQTLFDRLVLPDSDQNKLFIEINGTKIYDIVAIKLNDDGSIYQDPDTGAITFIRRNNSDGTPGETITVAPDSDTGLFKFIWGFTNTTDQNVKNPYSTFFPLNWTEDDIRDCIEYFINTNDKELYHFGISGSSRRGYQAHPLYRFEYVDPYTGNTIKMEVQVNGDTISSIYPVPKWEIDERPNTFDVVKYK